MDRIRRIAGIRKAKAPSAVQKDKDESIVFFRELYKHEKDTDVNLLEPMYSVEFDAIQGGHMPNKLPSRNTSFLVPVDEKRDYDWLKTPPAAPLFPSLEMEAKSSQTVFQKELPIPRPPKPSSSRFSNKVGATKTSAMVASPPDSSSKKIISGATSISKEKNLPCKIDKRSIYTAQTNKQQKAAPATAKGTTATSSKKHSDSYYASQGSSPTAAQIVASPAAEEPYKAPKNLLTTGSIFARRAPLTTVAKGRSTLSSDAKVESGNARRPPCPPAAATRVFKDLQVDGRQNVFTARGKAVTGSEPARYSGSRAGMPTPVKEAKRVDGKIERRPRFADM